jgi:tetratricopeptide (TPR) repeat protein/YHS domain-containing protein
MTVEEPRAPTSAHGGRTFYFCSPSCRVVFDQSPDDYVKLAEVVPPPLARLPELARNLWWSWHPEAAALVIALLLCALVGVRADARPDAGSGSGVPSDAAPKGIVESPGPTWESLAETGTRAFRAGRYDEAEAAYRQAVEVARRARPQDWRLVMSLTNLGHVVRARGRFEEAEALYRQALASAEAFRSEGHPDLLDSLKNLAVFYYDHRRYAEAEVLFARLVRMAARGSDMRDRVRQVAFLNTLADLAELQGRYGDAERYHHETIGALGVPEPFDRAALGMVLTQLSLLQRLLGRDAEALDTGARALQVLALAGRAGEVTLRVAVKTREETLGPGHPAVARMLQPLAFLLEAQGRDADAAVVWRRAIEILERSRPPASLDVAASLEAYAVFLAKQGLRGEARSAEARAAAIRGR